MKLLFYTKENCQLCDEAYTLLTLLQTSYPFDIEICDIYKDNTLLEEYQLLIPAVQIGNTLLTSESMQYEQLEEALQNSQR